MNENATWKNTLNSFASDAGWASLQDALYAAYGVGYKYVLWFDEKVYSYSFENGRGVLLVEPTEYRLEDLEKNT